MAQKSIESFLLKDASVLTETKEIKFSQFEEPFEIRSISATEYKSLEKQATRPVKQNGVMSTQLDQSKFMDLLAVTAITFPDLHEADLQEHFGTTNAADTGRAMLKAGQWAGLYQEISKLSGFDEEPVDDLVEEVKN
ncbi:hypothetical protein OIT44_03750 [Weissella ceti]|uniref:Phage XkdN-like protein n=1 Tax=Weissella ceti TaxID=759620 RepID=A0ABT3E466_9LACO|nr:hypothetical protein [Weissella ceti]MCW0953187.1 hypothetical protein [Weissella ceti]QVK12705.1 hypothetical protein KHQ31_03515 [Weissella ceti]